MARKTKKKKLTPMQAAYQKELKRINRYIRTKERQGYKFSESLEIPSMPKRVTQKALRTIKAITGRKLRLKLEVFPDVPSKPKKQDFEPTPPTKTPVTLPPISQKPIPETDEVVDEIRRFYEDLSRIPTRITDDILSVFRQWEATLDAEDIAEALNKMPRRVYDFLNERGSKFDFDAFEAEFLEYLPVNEGTKRDIMDITDQVLSGEYYG